MRQRIFRSFPPALACLVLALTGSSRFSSLMVQADDGVRILDMARLELRAEEGPRQDYASRVIVQFKDAVEDRLAERCVGDAGGARATRSAFMKRYVVEPMAGMDAEALTKRFLSMPEVEYAERDGVVRAHFAPNDGLYNLQWHLRTIGAERMWDIQRGDPTVAVAVPNLTVEAPPRPVP